MIEFRKKIDMPNLEINSEGGQKGKEAPEEQVVKEPQTNPNEEIDGGNDQNQTGDKQRLRKEGNDENKRQKEAGK